MTDLLQLFQDQDLPVSDFLNRLRTAELATADKAALKSVLKNAWNALQDEPADLDPRSLRQWKAMRGYQFESLVFKLLALEDLDPSPPYYAHLGYEGAEESSRPKRRGRRPGGEQIDGAFTLDGKYFLIEAKWQDPLGASEMYAFRGRVDGKLAGTIGVMISAAGFVEEAEYALLWGKEVNVILANGNDLVLALDQGRSFKEMIRAKLREAARTGQVFYAYYTFLDERGA
jgi:Restriction endonuclease